MTFAPSKALRTAEAFAQSDDQSLVALCIKTIGILIILLGGGGNYLYMT